MRSPPKGEGQIRGGGPAGGFQVIRVYQGRSTEFGPPTLEFEAMGKHQTAVLSGRSSARKGQVVPSDSDHQPFVDDRFPRAGGESAMLFTPTTSCF